MTRFHRNSHSRFRGRAIILLATAACMGNAHATEPESVIFAAENALYGSGFDIGRADGWLDSKLRDAIRSYQAANGLEANGNLDRMTLKALGVQAIPATTITANSVASRQRSVDVLGLSYPDPEPPAPSIVKTEAKPDPAPESKPEPETTAAPERRQQLPLEVKTVASSKPENVNRQIVIDETSTGDEVGSPEETVVVAQKTETTITEASTPATEPERKFETAAVESAPSESPVQNKTALVQQPPEPDSSENLKAEQPVAQEPEATQPAQLDKPDPVSQTAASRPQSSGGGFFSALFDFFFGWLV
ncbi:MAG: peptidoglycan-binding protein [Marinobacter sp.]|nr:peptidoglycan-binding protein [Marinobacter sp.]